MKYLLPFLLLGIICYSQKLPDDVKVTAYYIYQEANDGPCLISESLKSRENYISYATAESTDKEFAQKLLELKKYVSKRTSEYYPCYKRMIGGMPVPKMLVITATNLADTLFTDDTGQKIFFPEKQKVYIDKDKKLISLFPEIIREFHDYDWDGKTMLMYTGVRDSIKEISIMKNEKPLPDFITSLRTSPLPYTLASRDSLYEKPREVYAADNDTITIHEEVELKISNPNSLWSIAGIKIGDTEEKLKGKFPLSAAIPFIYKIRFEDIKRQYSYGVDFEGKKGRVEFFIKDHIIEGITIFYYE